MRAYCELRMNVQAPQYTDCRIDGATLAATAAPATVVQLLQVLSSAGC
jgi:hypothetical protein